MSTEKTNAGKDLSFVNPEPNERLLDPKTGKTISRKKSLFMAGGAMAAGAVLGDFSQSQEITEILLDSDGDGVADSTLTDENNDGVFEVETSLSEDNAQQTETQAQPWNPGTAPMAGSGTVSDNMSFSEAFSAAREELGAGGVFAWQGQYYNTFYAEELDDNNQPVVDYPTTDYHGLPQVDFNENAAESIHDEGGFESADTDSGSDLDPQALAADLDMDGNVDAVFVDLNLDGSADVIYTDINQDGQITEDEFIIIHDPADLVIPETPSDGSMMSVDTNADGIDDMLLADVDSDQVADMLGVDANRDQLIDESEISVLNAEAMEDTSFGPAEIEYSGEVSVDMPEDVSDEMLDSMDDDLSSLEDNFDEINEWS
ncbi:MAG: hypothetical protein IH597_09615 [Bacteroidales bacterium]|nr:hypothetical protein [Bacteroidales bacterium]